MSLGHDITVRMATLRFVKSSKYMVDKELADYRPPCQKFPVSQKIVSIQATTHYHPPLNALTGSAKWTKDSN